MRQIQGYSHSVCEIDQWFRAKPGNHGVWVLEGMIKFLCDSSSLLLIKAYKLVWGKNLNSHTQFGREMSLVSYNEACHVTRDGNLKEGFVVRVL